MGVAYSAHLLAADYAQLRRGDDAIRQAEMAVALHPSDSTVIYNAACTYGVLGKKAEALGMLRRAKAAGYSNEDWIHHDPDLASSMMIRNSEPCILRLRRNNRPIATGGGLCGDLPITCDDFAVLNSQIGNLRRQPQFLSVFGRIHHPLHGGLQRGLRDRE
jgi:hypothetical protein